MSALSDRWVKSKYSDSIYHATFENYREPDKPVIIELEQGSSGNVWCAMRYAGELWTPGDEQGYPSFAEASEAGLKAFMKLMQHRRKSFLICDFYPYENDREIKAAYGVSQATANNWRNRNWRKPMSRRSIQMILASLGLIFSGRGKTEHVKLGPAWWDQGGGEDENTKRDGA